MFTRHVVTSETSHALFALRSVLNHLNHLNRLALMPLLAATAPAWAATLIVTHSNNSGAGSLRALRRGLGAAWRCLVLLAVMASLAPAQAAAPYVVQSNGTVINTSNGLVWDQCSFGQSGSTCTGTANQYLFGMFSNPASHKGYTDWRVPNKAELLSLVVAGPMPTIDTTAFPGTLYGVSDFYWTSEYFAPDPSTYAVFVTFRFGNEGQAGFFDPGYIRLVRSGLPFASSGTAPLVSTVALSNIPSTSATLNATSSAAGTGYWLAVPHGSAAPTARQVVDGATYGSVSTVLGGSAPMLAATPKAFNITGLVAGTAYDVYFVAVDANLNASAVSGPVKTNQTITAIATPPNIAFNGTSALSTTGGSGTGAVSFAVTTGNTFCSITGSTLAGTGVGTCTVTATKAADANYNAATATESVTVGKAAQAISFTSTAPASPTVGGASYTVTATGGGSGNPVTFSIDAASTAGACAIASGVVSFTGAGSCIVDANQVGNGNYNAAPQAQQSLTVGQGNQTALTAIANPANIAFNATSALSTTGGTGAGAVSYAVTAGGPFCSITGSTLTGTGVGTCTVTATKAADANYNATTATVNVSVGLAHQAALIGVATPANIVFNATSALSTTGGSGTGAVSYAVTAGNAFCAVAGSTLTGTGVGTCTVTATKAADANYNATTATVNVTVAKAATTTSLSPPTSITLGQSVSVTASVSVTPPGSGTATGTVTISDGGTGAGDSCTITLPATSCALTPSTAGNKTLTVTYSGDGNFVASGTSGSLAVDTNATLIALSSSPNPSKAGQSVQLTATVIVLPPASSVGIVGLKRAGDAANATAVPTGSVTFSDGAMVLGTAPLNGAGVATLTTTMWAQGVHMLTAQYSGDSNSAVAVITAAQQVDPVPPVPVSGWILAMLAALLAMTGARLGVVRQKRIGL